MACGAEKRSKLRGMKPKKRFKYVISDRWFSSKENMVDIKIKHQKDFVLPVKSNRTLTLSVGNKDKGNFISIESLRLEAGSTSDVYLRGLDFPVRLIKQVLQTRAEVAENCCSFPATGSFPLMKSRQSIKNDGRLKNFINPSNRMPLSQNHRQARWELKAINALRQFTHSLNLKSWESRQDWIILPLRGKFISRLWKSHMTILKRWVELKIGWL